ncbi:MAG: DUF58 domain-containing protein, partial [Myxococcales bacterium]|nr:DUF58 domain-containing protein [Myxococcales bacterium]
LETGELTEFDTSDKRVREAFHSRFAKERARREQLFQRMRIDHMAIRTDQDYVRPIAELFRRRESRMRGYR